MRVNDMQQEELKEIQLEFEVFQQDQTNKDGLSNLTDPFHQQELSQEPMLESHGEVLGLMESDSVALSQEQKHQSELFSPEDLEGCPLLQNNDQTLLKD